MALRTVQQWKSGIAGLVTGLNLNNVTNLDEALSRTARRVAQNIDAPEATGREPITLYSGVYYYEAPENIFGTAVNLIRPSGNAPYNGLYNYKVPIDVFTRGKYNFGNGYTLDLEYDKGEGVIGISSNVPLPRVLLSPMSDSADFVAAGSASGLATDTVNYWESPAALRFNLTGASTGTITGTTQESVDLTDYEGVGVVFLAIETPSAANLTSIDVRIGSDSSNYYSKNETEGFLGAWTVDTWLLVAFDLASAGTTGTPDISAIDYLQVRINHAASIANFRLGGCWVSMPSLNEIIYQTAAIFKNPTTGVLSNEIGSDNDLIILNDAAFTILEYEGAKDVSMQQAGGTYTDQIKGFDDILMGGNAMEGLYQRYTANNPSNQLRQIDSYYDDQQRGRSRN